MNPNKLVNVYVYDSTIINNLEKYYLGNRSLILIISIYIQKKC